MDTDAKRNKPIAKLLTAAGLDLDAARRLLTEPPNALAANHLQQAAEKIISAVRLHRGLLNTKDHDLVILIDGRPVGDPRPLPEGDPWRDRLRPLEPLSAYATTFRYSLSPISKIETLRAMLVTLSEFTNWLTPSYLRRRVRPPCRHLRTPPARAAELGAGAAARGVDHARRRAFAESVRSGKVST